MFGYVEWNQKKGKRVGIQERRIMHLPFCTAVIRKEARTSPIFLRYRCRTAARRLAHEGVKQAVFPQNFPYYEEFARFGIQAVNPLSFYRSLAAKIILQKMKSRRIHILDAGIAVCSSSLTAEVRRTVTELCISNRYVTLCAGGEGDSFCRQLRREYGVSLVVTDDSAQLAQAGGIILFAPRADLPADALTVQLYDGGTLPEVELRLNDGREEELPEDVCRPQLYAALYTAGILLPGQMEVSTFEKPGKDVA